jgi:hypothetical protein
LAGLAYNKNIGMEEVKDQVETSLIQNEIKYHQGKREAKNGIRK